MSNMGRVLHRKNIFFPRKGQAAIEFLSLMIVIMIISVAAYEVVYSRISDSGNIYNLQFACRKIASGINSALVFGNGFSTNITLPEGTYTASILGDAVLCKDSENVFIETVLSNVTNSSGSKDFTLSSLVKIKNDFDEIIIT